MKVTHVVTCALVAFGLSASAASIEQVLDFSVTGWYQGVTTNVGVIQRDRTAIVRITSDNVVKALAIDRDTNYFYGRLFYKTALDGSTTNVVIRQAGKTNELDVTDAFTFSTAPFVVDQVVNTSRLFTNSYVETGLLGVSFSSSSVTFQNIGFSVGKLTRTHKLSGRVDGTPVSGYANLLSYAGGGGFITLNTNTFYKTNFQFAATNFVVGPAQINVRTFAPVISPN
jgi:hypothetical protein